MNIGQSRSRIFVWALAVVVLLLQGCGSSNSETTDGSLIACATSASVTSGSVSTANTAVTLSNLIVTIYNGTEGGTYTLSLPDGSSQTVSSTSYTYPNSFNLTTGSSGGINSTVTVKDNETGSTGSCALSIPGSSSSSSGVVSLAASATSVVKNSSVTLTATASSVTSPVFSFSQTSTYPSYVTISSTSNGVATITSSVAQTVTVTATMTSNASGAASASATATITFTETGSVGGASVSLTASPSTQTVGSNVTVTAVVSGISDPIYQYYFVSNTIGANGSFSGPTATFTASAAGTATLGVTVYSSSNGSLTATNQVTITFTSGSGGGTALTCYLTHGAGTFYRYSSIPFYVWSSTGEALRLTYWDPGEAWDGAPPSFPLYLPQVSGYGYFSASYSFAGTKSVRVQVESATRPGTFCNGGAILTDSIYVN